MVTLFKICVWLAAPLECDLMPTAKTTTRNVLHMCQLKFGHVI